MRKLSVGVAPGGRVQVSFGPFRLDADSRQLLCRRKPVHLSPKAFELLKTLVAARPRALSKEEIHDRLWPATFVSDANLAILIGEIRRALDDDAHAPRYVRTLHGFGYAFLAETRDVGHPEERASRADVSYWLIWRKRKFALVEGENLVGRSPVASVWLDVPGVSREHARVTIEGGSATLQDLGSRNGTFRAGDRVAGPVALHDRDRVQLGPVVMTFRVWRPGAGTTTQDLSEPAAPASSGPR